MNKQIGMFYVEVNLGSSQVAIAHNDTGYAQNRGQIVLQASELRDLEYAVKSAMSEIEAAEEAKRRDAHALRKTT